MEISLQKDGTSGAVALKGQIGREHVSRLQDYAQLLLDNGVSTVYFDFSGARSMSVSAIGALCHIRDLVEESGGELVLTGLRRELNSLVSIDHLGRFFSIRERAVTGEWIASSGNAPSAGAQLPAEQDDENLAPEDPPRTEHSLIEAGDGQTGNGEAD